MSQGEGTVLPFKEKWGVGEGASLALALCRPPVQHQGLWCGRGQVSGESLWDKGDAGPSLGYTWDGGSTEQVVKWDPGVNMCHWPL